MVAMTKVKLYGNSSSSLSGVSDADWANSIWEHSSS